MESLGIVWPGWIGGAAGFGLAVASFSDLATARNWSRFAFTAASGPVNFNDVT